VIRSLQETFPLSATMSEEIATLRDWSRNRTRPASSAQRSSHAPPFAGARPAATAKPVVR
jgi:hypothetical protein